MNNVYIEVANRIAFIMRTEQIGFDTAFTQVIQNYNLDFATTRREVGSILGKRQRSPRKKKVPGQQLNLFSGMTRAELLQDVAKCEASLVAGIPEHDL